MALSALLISFSIANVEPLSSMCATRSANLTPILPVGESGTSVASAVSELRQYQAQARYYGWFGGQLLSNRMRRIARITSSILPTVPESGYP
jgi:hypothetical protein